MSDLLRGANLSYRALFTWLNPIGYVSSRLIRPIGITITFTATASHYGAAVGPTLVGTSLLAGAHALIYGMALSVGNERVFGTMAAWLASPQNILGAICQRAIPHAADGFVSGLITYLVCSLLYRDLPLSIGWFVPFLVIALASAFGMGLLIAGVNLRVKDTFVWPNVAVLAMMIFSGVLIDSSRLPASLRPLSVVFPLSHLMSSVRTTPSPGGAGGAMLAELAAGAVWALAGVVVIRWFLRRRAAE